MKKIFLLAIVSLFIFSCKKNKTTTSPGNQADVIIKFNNYIGGAAIQQDKYLYTNAAGNLYTVNLLKYYVTKVVLMTDDNKEVELENYDLIDAFSPTNYSTVDGKAIPNGVYTTMKFNLGIDSARNHTGAQDGDLDPSRGMIWDWNTGYLFMKHEGKFVAINGDTLNVSYHLGTDRAFSTVYVPISLNVDGYPKTMNIDFDLNKMYLNPVINFNDGNYRHSTDILDKQWISDMLINAQNAFTFKNVN